MRVVVSNNDPELLASSDAPVTQPAWPKAIRREAAADIIQTIPTVSEWTGGGATAVPAFDATSATPGLSYCRGRLKRAFDLMLSLAALIILLIPLLVVAVLVALTSHGPVFYWQARFGLDGRTFRLWKFRSMKPGADQGPLITASGDTRVTTMGRLLRSTKIDELPQLINVIRGDMSIVGPRPQTAPYVEACKEEYSRILKVKPGLTDPATIEFRHEESILQAIPEDRRDVYYKTRILRRKIDLNMEYIRSASLAYDLELIARTVLVLAQRKRSVVRLTNTSPSAPEA